MTGQKVRDASSLITRVFLTLSLFSKVKSISHFPKRYSRSRTVLRKTGTIWDFMGHQPLSLRDYVNSIKENYKSLASPSMTVLDR